MYGQVIITEGGWVSSDDQSDYEPVDNISALNTSATSLGFSLRRFSEVSQRDMTNYVGDQGSHTVADDLIPITGSYITTYHN